ncbi:unnamed protein product [Lymnaea stagnalis]|uniref:Uncharacterized protein n=1 Tax=Lymnaea stagnalis TaxID=6523 RepID=A0AAV2I7T6_LYMST
MASRELTKLKPKTIQVNGKALSTKTELSNASLYGSNAAAAWSSEPTSPTEPSAVEQIMDINRRLVSQIETLRLKVEVDTRHHETTKSKLISSNKDILQTRELEIQNLKSDLKSKEDAVKTLAEQNTKKGVEIKRLQEHIEELRKDVMSSKTYADEIQKQLDQLNKDKHDLESGAAYKEKDDQIKKLEHEVTTLKQNLQTLERELTKAKEKISQQGAILRFAEHDRENTRIQFKEELAKVSLTMRNEIEKLRDVMRQQWEEMRELREQNESMRSDIKEIRELLVETHRAEKHVADASKPEVHSSYPYGPTLPALSNKTRRVVLTKKKS